MPVTTTARRAPQRVVARTLVLGASALLAAAAMLTWGPSSTSGWNQGAAEGTLWQLLNGARTNNGMAPLQQHGTLVGIARWRSSDMLARNYFSHTIPGCGCLVYAYYDSNGLAYDWAGENIGWNSGLDDAHSPVRVHEKFMGSAGHRANVLTAAFTHGAVGAAAGDGPEFQGYVQNTRMYTELFLQAPGGCAGAGTAAACPGARAGRTTARRRVAEAVAAAAVARRRLSRAAGGPGRARQPEPTPKKMTVAAPTAPDRPPPGLDGIPPWCASVPARNLAARLRGRRRARQPAATPPRPSRTTSSLSRLSGSRWRSSRRRPRTAASSAGSSAPCSASSSAEGARRAPASDHTARR